MATILGKEFLLGCDPEVFVVDRKGNFVSAHGLIPGTKTAPMKVNNGMVQVDGMALEFGIDPAATKKEFVTRIKDVLAQLRGMLPKGYDISVSSIARFTPEIMAAQPEEALELGCDPDYNAYTGAKNARPTLPDPNLRSAGGHIHIGWGSKLPVLEQQHLDACSALAVEMDYFIGAASLKWDKDVLRRTIYGAAGAFRPKPYGMEYRSASNQWLQSEELIGFVYDSTILAITNLMQNNSIGAKNLPFFKGAVSLPAFSILNTGWVSLGEAIFDSLNKQVSNV